MFDFPLSVKGVFHDPQHLSVSTTHIPTYLKQKNFHEVLWQSHAEPQCEFHNKHLDCFVQPWQALWPFWVSFSLLHTEYIGLDYIWERKLQNPCQKR